ncbi:hypothetical protein ABZ671_06615 [Micromonospora sp. NPDC006766]|uniref:DUF4190 domain-containing protein n=1 Tax=Micromonospora sp. NPDC006766 TaxID=3154778 RepID=UPI0033F3E646
MQPGYPGQDPYGEQPPQDPAAPQQPQDPYAQPPAAPQYGQQPYQDPYAQQQPYGAPTYPTAGYPQPQGQQNTLGLVSMILGIASIPLSCCAFIGIPVGIAGAVTGYLGRQKAAQGLANNDGQAKAGLICGAVGAGLSIAWIILNTVLSFSLPTAP